MSLQNRSVIQTDRLWTGGENAALVISGFTSK